MELQRFEIPYGDQNLILETGKIAKQADGSVTVTCGGTVVLATACMSREPRAGIDFLPLMIEYQEKTYAAGRIPGGFFKREGRPSTSEILAARAIDRPIRPLLPQGLRHEIQVVCLVLSHDGKSDPDVLGIIGASAALSMSHIPFDGPIGAVRVGMVDGQLILNPNYQQRAASLLDVILVSVGGKVIMIEGEAHEASEQQVLDAISFGLEKSRDVISAQEQLVRAVGKKKAEVSLVETHPGLIKKLTALSHDRIAKICTISEKEERDDALGALLEELTADMSVFAEYAPEGKEVSPADITAALHELEAQEVRRIILKDHRRIDGRGLTEIRPITCDVGTLPRTHGSSIFTRGQTQSLAIATLGTRDDEQMIDDLEGKTFKTFMLHYNFPSFSVGETRPMRGPGRREIGHGALAEKAIRAVMPKKEEFPYTVRIVSEILESNGSSSMATVCSGILCLMDAGVPIKDPVSGISIGLVTDGKESALLTDIMGAEDHFGDMDFKVAGTRKGITAIQLDLKVQGIDAGLLTQAFQQAKEARFIILDKMYQALPAPREELSEYAPRITTLTINPEKIGEVIGPSGKTIRKIIEETGVTIDIEDDGTVLVASTDAAASAKAIGIIQGIIAEPEIGRVYDARVKRVTNFGAFCEYLPGKEGLVHISELSSSYVKDINKVVKVGDEFKVKIVEIDEMNRVNLSKKQADEAYTPNDTPSSKQKRTSA